MNDVSRNRKWNALLRIGGLAAAIGGMYISATFSVNGFQFSTDTPSWMGWAIAGIIIVLESVWQKFGKNRTLFAIAVVCYSYGIITNVVGIAQAKGGYAQMDILDYLVAIVFGTLFEIFPEPLLAWAISGDVSSDPLGKLLDGLEEDKPQPKMTQRPISNQQAFNNLPKKQPVMPSFQPKPKKHIQYNPNQAPWPPKSNGYMEAVERGEE